MKHTDNIYTMHAIVVAPRAGAWIETITLAIGESCAARRPPRGGVD